MGAKGEGSAKDEPVVSGVPLAQYAAVTAALAEPFPLEDVLAAEELDPARWAEAELGWTERLAEDAALLPRYQAALAAAEDRLARKVEPIDGDLSAWVAFLGAFTAAPATEELLLQHGLGPNDLSRLHRRWAARMKAEPALEKRAAELRKKGPGRLPRLRVGNASLVGSGAGIREAPDHAESKVPAAGAPPLPDLSLADFAALSAELHLRPSASERILARFGVPPGGLGALERSFAVRFAADPSLEKDFLRLRAHHRTKSTLTSAQLAAALPRSPDPPRPNQPPPPASPPVAAEDPETLTAYEVSGPSVPFGATPSRAFLEAMEHPGAALGEGSDGETVSLGPSEPLGVPPIADGDQAIFEEATHDLHRVLTQATPEEEPPGSKPSPSQTVKMKLPEERTALLDLAAPEPLRLAETVSVVAPLSTRALPFAEPEEDDAFVPTVELRVKKPKAEPEPVTTAQPVLSMERHASLCLELALDPGHAEETLARYQVTAEDKELADRHYKAQSAADPAFRTAWNRAFETYRAWFNARRSRP
jgi:hypothetical protein